MMRDPILTLADMLAPIAPATCFREFWETKPLHLRRGDSGFYEQLLTRHDIDRAIRSGGLRFPAIQLAVRGRFLAPEAFTRTIRSGEDIFAGVPDLERLGAAYRSGATISLPGFQRAWEPLGRLAQSIEDEISHPVHTNVYVTPGNAAGFTPHFDTHEIFILQIAGTKHWTIHQPPLALPHRCQNFDATNAVSAKPLLSIEMEPGDLLYLPRGFVHSTATSRSFSMHVTLGITVYTWVELLTEWVQLSRNNPDMRRALPPGFATRPALSTGLAQMLASLQQNTDQDAFLDAFLHRITSARSRARTEFNTDVTVTGRIDKPDSFGK